MAVLLIRHHFIGKALERIVFLFVDRVLHQVDLARPRLLLFGLDSLLPIHGSLGALQLLRDRHCVIIGCRLAISLQCVLVLRRRVVCPEEVEDIVVLAIVFGRPMVLGVPFGHLFEVDEVVGVLTLNDLQV